MSMSSQLRRHHGQKANGQTPKDFLFLPPEIHYLIASHLPYPDLLSLTLTHPDFRNNTLICTSKASRVDWLIDRATLRLPLPNRTRCRWSSDVEFSSNSEVATILYRRRHHLECAEMFLAGTSGGKCAVVVGGACNHLVEGLEQLNRERRSGSLPLSKAGAFRKPALEAIDLLVEGICSWKCAAISFLLAAALWLVI